MDFRTGLQISIETRTCTDLCPQMCLQWLRWHLMDHGKICPVIWNHIPLVTFQHKQEVFNRSSVMYWTSMQLSKKRSCCLSLTHKNHLLQHSAHLLTLRAKRYMSQLLAKNTRADMKVSIEHIYMCAYRLHFKSLVRCLHRQFMRTCLLRRIAFHTKWIQFNKISENTKFYLLFNNRMYW